MANLRKASSLDIDRDVEQAIFTLKKGAYLLKYGRMGKPKFRPFRLSNDESTLIWYSGKDEKQLKLSHVSRIIPGQCTATFQRYPRPEKEYQSFSLICNDRTLDLICKDKDEAEVWFVGLKALISRRKWRSDLRSNRISTDGPSTHIRRNSPRISPLGSGEIFQKERGETQQNHVPYGSPPRGGFVKAFSDVILYTAATKPLTRSDSSGTSHSSVSYGSVDTSNSVARGSAVDSVRSSLSRTVSLSSQGSYEEFDALGYVFIWGGVGDGTLGEGMHGNASSSITKVDAVLPRALRSTMVLDAHQIGCGRKHAVLVTKQGGIYSWGEESEGRLGHGVEADVSHPKLIKTLNGMNIEQVSCGEYHTCAITLSGDLYTWGDGIRSSSLLGHVSEASHWIPKKVSGQIESFHISTVVCGPWHTAFVTSAGQLFTFGDGTFGALGHGDRRSSRVPREVECFKELRTIRVACGVWHTAAIVEVKAWSSTSGNSSSGKLFTWGDGDKGQLGHADKEPRLVPACVASLVDVNFCQVACGNSITVALTTSGRVYTMGSTSYGQLGISEADKKTPYCVEGKLIDSFVEEIACGSHHVAVLTSKTEVYTWGKGANGQLGHGDTDDRPIPTLVEALKDKQVKNVVCGSNFTAVIYRHKWVSSVGNSICSGCHSQFSFRRKRHNCYNCGLVFCTMCSSKKSFKASFAPILNKAYRVCDECYFKLKKPVESGTTSRLARNQSGPILHNCNSDVEKDTLDPRLRGQLSRIVSGQSLKVAENKTCRRHRSLELEPSRFAPTPTASGGIKWQSFDSIKSTSLIGTSKKLFISPAPGSKELFNATFPVSRKSIPSQSTKPIPTDTTDPEIGSDTREENESLSQEIVELRTQVENLTCKSRLLEYELDRKSKQLEETTTKACEGAARCKAAKEVIRSLAAQLKEKAEILPSGSSSSSSSDSGAGDKSSNLSTESNVSQMSSPTSEESESDDPSRIPVSSNGTESNTEFADCEVQDEPGVYMILSSLPGGGKTLRRIRFSRQHFSEKQAEEWWAENRVKVYERHGIR